MATDPSTYLLNHTMLRVKDPEASIKFYEFLGMKKINQIENPAGKFSLHFLAYDSPGAPCAGKNWTDRSGVLELTHNYGTEEQDDFKIANGNSNPGRGFGHICISVDNIQASCQRLEDAGVKFQKKLTDGRMRHIAFALDPDGYWVEIIPHDFDIEKTKDIKTTDLQTYRFNHSMIRVKDKDVSLNFYEDVMGMKLIHTSEAANAGFNLYFLSYADADDKTTRQQLEGLVELTWNYGTEKDTSFHYHSGNTDPQGFGHICVSVDDLDKACERFKGKGVQWKKRLTDGKSRDLAFVLDPDGYWIEIIQNERYKKRAGW